MSRFSFLILFESSLLLLSSLSKCWSLSHVKFFVTPWVVACQAPMYMGLSRQEYWVGCHFLFQGIFLTWGSNPGLLHCRQILYHLSHQGSPGLIKGFTILFIFSKKRVLVWLIFSIVFCVLYFIYFFSGLCHFFPSANLGLSPSFSSSLRYLI